jgi:hypothetical protein
MAASKNRLRWDEMPESARAAVEKLIAGRVMAAENCEGGFSPGLASRLVFDDGRQVFVKAIDAAAWPVQAGFYRSEATVAAALPGTVAAPRLIGALDAGRWVALAFEWIAGPQPRQPWHPAELDRVLAAVAEHARAMTPSPIELPRDHPRLGGWDRLARDSDRLARLPAHSAWAAGHLPLLMRLEELGRDSAQGTSLVHFDLYPHNILLTPDRVLFADWPHARLGAPFIDLLTVLCSTVASGIDPEPALAAHPLTASLDPRIIDAFLAALAGFYFDGALEPRPPGLAPVTAAKFRLAEDTLRWLVRRLGSTGQAAELPG